MKTIPQGHNPYKNGEAALTQLNYMAKKNAVPPISADKMASFTFVLLSIMKACFYHTSTVICMTGGRLHMYCMLNFQNVQQPQLFSLPTL